MSETTGHKVVTACVLLIGNELLSGRTQDANLAYIAKWSNERGIQVREARIIPDEEAVIVAALNEMRPKFDYVFTTGGIGPTHDDITADCVAKAFNVKLDYHPEVLALLDKYYRPGGFTEARKRMARIPEGGVLIPNPVSRAPGFQIENVFVLAGIPRVMQAQLEGLAERLSGAAAMLSRTISVELGEGIVAADLTELQGRFPDVLIGSYPFFKEGLFGTSLVMRSYDTARLDEAAEEVRRMVRRLGAEPHEGELI